MGRYDIDDTIAAIASPPGPAARGIVRLSGPESWSIAATGFTPDDDRPLPTRAEMRDGTLRLAGFRPTLPASITFWPPPRTYTGQALAEVHLIGSPPVLDCLLAHYLSLGARLAEPGEFTLRAFLSGRIDLTRAEAVHSVIDARTPAQLDAALAQLAGGLSGPIERLRDRLLDLVAHLEAGLDFVDEEDVDPIAVASLVSELASASEEVASLASRLHGRHRPEGLPRVVLIGPPNAGKSRLFNALAGESLALVSAVAGTTRDYLTRRCAVDGVEFELIDTAGIDSASDAIEAEAQALRAEQALAADLLLRCRSADIAAVSFPAACVPVLDVWTKSDLAPAPAGMLSTSASSGTGLDDLRAAITSSLRRQDHESDPLASSGARCRDSLERAAASLRDGTAALAAGLGDELVAIDLRQAIDELGKVVGAVVTDDILDRLFRRFCIGK